MSYPQDIQRIVETVVESTAKIIVVFSSDVDLSPLILELLRHNVTNRTWIASEAWVTSALINQPGVSQSVVREALISLNKMNTSQFELRLIKNNKG